MSTTELERRIVFHKDFDIMEVDFSNMSFETSAQVDEFYDEVEKRIEETGKKWYFLVNYENCSIEQKAWVSFGVRGKRVNLASSLGTVRFNARADTADTIEEKARKEDFDPNLFRTRSAALARIMELQRDGK